MDAEPAPCRNVIADTMNEGACFQLSAPQETQPASELAVQTVMPMAQYESCSIESQSRRGITAATRIRTSLLVHFEIASEYVVVVPDTAFSPIFLRNGRITATTGVAQAATCARLLKKRDPWRASICGLAAPKEPN